MRWILFAAALVFLGLGLLTVFKSPDWVDWRCAVFVGQYGYIAAVVPLALAAAAIFSRGGRGALAMATCAVCAASAVLLVQPCFQARAVARILPQNLTLAFGRAHVDAEPFSFSRLFRLWRPAAPKSTYTYSGDLQLDFYPAIGRNPAPCVVVVHGGGWDNGDRGQIAPFNDWLAGEGYAVADISYRLAPGAVWPAQRDDVAAAVAFVKSRAAAWGVDSTRIVIFGRSAGGQIAEAAAYALHDPDVRGVIGLYAPADMNFAWAWGRSDDPLNSPELLRRFLGGTPQTARAAYDSASGILLVNGKSPPTLLVHGTIDTLVWNRQSERLAARLTAAEVPNLLVSLPWGTHALELNLSSPSGQLTTYSVEWFLGAVCR